jgi:hypothetical protein
VAHQYGLMVIGHEELHIRFFQSGNARGDRASADSLPDILSSTTSVLLGGRTCVHSLIPRVYTHGSLQQSVDRAGLLVDYAGLPTDFQPCRIEFAVNLSNLLVSENEAIGGPGAGKYCDDGEHEKPFHDDDQWLELRCERSITDEPRPAVT